MNDRFKFRVWDNENNEYLDEAYPSSIYSDGSLYAFEEKYDANSNEMVALLEIPNNCLIVEQCTGLRDKNGRLIHEGDICLLYGSKYEIRWKDGGFGMRDYPPCADTDGYIFSQTIPFTNRLYLREDLKEIEVVGTIHDNPEEAWPVTPQGKPLPKETKTWERGRSEKRKNADR